MGYGLNSNLQTHSEKLSNISTYRGDVPIIYTFMVD